MCGIIAVVRRKAQRPVPASSQVVGLVEPVASLMAGRPEPDELAGALGGCAERLSRADKLLRGVPGTRALLGDPGLLATLDELLGSVCRSVEALEADLDSSLLRVGALDGAGADGDTQVEEVNAGLIALKDALWAIQRDRLRTARAVGELAGAEPGEAAVAAFTSIQQALSALDRLEVRGRDSAGLYVLVRDHGLDLDDPSLVASLRERGRDPLFGSLSVRVADGHLGFVYKAAAEIGELGDNTRALRAAIRDDGLLKAALAAPSAQALVLGHTRWASVGTISAANAHPLDSEELDAAAGPYVTAALNGDVDNFADLKASSGLAIAPEITTDAKVIPTLASRRIAASAGPDGLADVLEAFRSTVNKLDGSMGIAASSASEPADLLLALRGSGQALYVGLAEDAYIVASEPYGVVEEAERYLRMDGETMAEVGNPASRGQLVRLRGDGAGSIEGIERASYDGRALPVVEGDLARPQITTRDIDRGDFPHFLLKEISQAPDSFRKTLRGKLVETPEGLEVRMPEGVLSEDLRRRLRDGHVKRVLVIGQGTAAVAGHSLAVGLGVAAPDADLAVIPVLATELSGFDLRADMSDTLVVAISQSGTTTDTNRTVDLVRARGASVIAIVNRRNSDLTDKVDGVLYTSDGRDVEMAVASTKAFYSQIAACFLLAFAISAEVRGEPTPTAEAMSVLEALRSLPEAMTTTLALRPQLARAAQELAPRRRYWAIVGNGVNRIAAAELRIKLSELCYKSIACDSTEDKKHIDLSSEPLIVVCAAGLNGSTADDVAKEVAIYRAHKAAPLVIATEGDARFGAALQAVLVPQTHPSLAFVLAAMAGHLFGYEAALAIDAQALPLREARAAVETVVAEAGADDGLVLLERLNQRLVPLAARFFDDLRSGEHDGHLDASAAVKLASLLRYALGTVPLESYQAEHGKVGTPAVVMEDLLAALTRAIEELTRPVDAIKHQAKTVTVGISRADETLLSVRLVREVLDTGVARDHLSYSALRTLAALDPLVADVLGYTRYAVERYATDGAAASVALGEVPGVAPEQTAVVVDKGGLGRELRSRTEDNPVLRGTKHRVANERQVLLARGRSDGRTVLIVPELKEGVTVGLSLLHVSLVESLPLTTLRGVLAGYRDRYEAIKDAVTETEPTFRDDLLADVPLVELMTDPVYELAERWR